MVIIDEADPGDDRASRAMKILRQRYDKTYGWCMDCDFLGAWIVISW